MYKVSVTTIEKFRRFMNEVSISDTEENLIEAIKGTFTGTDKTKFGRAYHKIIEGDFQKDGKYYLVDGLQIPATVAKPALEYRKNHKVISYEIPVSKVYLTHMFPVLVTGRVDSIEGLHIRDAKARFRNIVDKEYTESVQWKFYLDMLDADHFWYDLFEIKGFESLLSIGDLQVIPHDPLECQRYPGMTEEITSVLCDLFDYIESRDLFEFIKQISKTEQYG